MLSNSGDPQEQNWQNFCANHLRDWYGIWTRYSAQGEVIESFQSLRSLKLNQEQTGIDQTNRYTYADGRIEEKNWQSTKQSKNLSDGIVHPKTSLMRSLYFEQGAAAWVTNQLKLGDFFHSGELFFRYENLRHSVGAVYDESGGLLRITSIREDSLNFPSKYWSKQLELLPKRNISGKWQGISVTMTSDLKVSLPVPIKQRSFCEENETFFLPDGIFLNCPKKVNIGNHFTIIANWLITSSHLQQLILKYNLKGEFSTLTLEIFNRSE
ncbi:DUF3598 family protein [Mastigocoleus testarum]|uniref:Uncharacterized protein n=1 Tax=Mastigocoleus testarum BC008 TaxID=371196 RepID=A0A0V7ZWJ1_9CYAN|nr:DUF3598 family protein [Mastigocoleus testarum]KST68927.1 hypothetical protein BC008_02300 [Mastigocoleus testarum BC008]KST68996.1 hypothetical protein BC008_02715 [Mastigocoleus testarum BC008]